MVMMMGPDLIRTNISFWMVGLEIVRVPTSEWSEVEDVVDVVMVTGPDLIRMNRAIWMVGPEIV